MQLRTAQKHPNERYLMNAVYMVTAGNVIDDYNEGNNATDNVVEIFDNNAAAEAFGGVFDFYVVQVKDLRTKAFVNVDMKF